MRASRPRLYTPYSSRYSAPVSTPVSRSTQAIACAREEVFEKRNEPVSVEIAV